VRASESHHSPRKQQLSNKSTTKAVRRPWRLKLKKPGRKPVQNTLARKPLSKRLRERGIRVLEFILGNAMIAGLA
jgi:hypothetical protein